MTRAPGQIGTKEERAADRRAIQRREIRKARRQALILGRSGKCAGEHREPVHAGQPDGCGNDGSSCICECHDPAAGSSGAAS